MRRLEIENSNTKEYYNKALVEHFRTSGLDESDMWRIDALLDKYYGGRLLDIGCGVSPLATMVAKYGDEVYAVDFADELIELLKERYPYVHYAVADFNALPFEDGFFQYVVLGEILEHSASPIKLLEEAFRVLKKGGRLALSTPLEEKEETHTYSQHLWSIGVEDIIGMIGKERILGMNIISNNIICHAKK